jgi:hypothetical protein
MLSGTLLSTFESTRRHNPEHQHRYASIYLSVFQTAVFSKDFLINILFAVYDIFEIVFPVVTQLFINIVSINRCTSR